MNFVATDMMSTVDGTLTGYQDVGHMPKSSGPDKKFLALQKDLRCLAKNLNAPEETTEKAIEILHIV